MVHNTQWASAFGQADPHAQRRSYLRGRAQQWAGRIAHQVDAKLDKSCRPRGGAGAGDFPTRWRGIPGGAVQSAHLHTHHLSSSCCHRPRLYLDRMRLGITPVPGGRVRG
jgi:hypothetical protein